MTYEQFDKATQIHVSMNDIYALQDVIGNCKNGRYIASATVGINKDYEVINYAKLPTHIMEKFEKILWEELDALKTEFNKL